MTQNGTDLDSPAPTAGAGAGGELAAAVNRLPEVLSVQFTTKIMGGAYDRHEVDRFIGELSQSVAQVRDAAASTQQEFAALQAENERLRGGAGSDLEEEVTERAMSLLSQAQLIADKAIADAERYARELVLAARTQYREILERAETRAGQAPTSPGAAQQPVPTVPEIEYVRTYARVAQIQLRSVLEALTEQVDRLGSLPQPPQEAGPRSDDGSDPAGEPEWSPSTSELRTLQG